MLQPPSLINRPNLHPPPPPLESMQRKRRKGEHKEDLRKKKGRGRVHPADASLITQEKSEKMQKRCLCSPGLIDLMDAGLLFFFWFLLFFLVSLSLSLFYPFVHKIRCSDEEKNKKTSRSRKRAPKTLHKGHLRLLLSGLLANPGVLGGAGLEAVLESSGNVLEVAAATSANGPSPLGLLAPVVCKERKYC